MGNSVREAVWFIDGPSLFASIDVWEKHMVELEDLMRKHGENESISYCIERAKRIIEAIKDNDIYNN